MRHLGFLASLAMTLLAALPIKAQTENEAFYIYQNDGHFDGFFYDEIVKMNFSFLDTLGIEHDEIVSQEIVTADSTYRFMLSAIDSIGFVQPEVKFNPKLRKLSLYKTDKKDEFIDEQSIWYYYNKNDATLTFDPRNLPAELQPQIDDVFLFQDAEDGFALKVVSFKQNGFYLVACCEPIDDITEIFQQFITVEEYGYDDGGNMVKRRIAGQPDLTIGKFPKKSKKAESGWEGDVFNFSISGHVPLYATDKLNITIDPTIEGKLHLKTVWNLSWFGDKYIGITSKLKFGVGIGFTVDGKIMDFFPSGIGKLGSIPVPATCPLLIIDCGPDVFLRGEAHVNFKMSTPKLNGAMWSKLELKNWIPSIDMGFGNSDDGSEFESVDKTSAGITMSLNGFIQGGMLFPLKFKSLPLLRKICDVEVGGQWFVGPKVSADFTLDLTTKPWDDVATYNQLKNITLGLHLMDADFEVKAKAETLAGVSDVTLADGSISLFPPLDVKLVPEFGECVEYVEVRGFDKCRIWAFEPQGYVIKPVTIGTKLFQIKEDGTMVLVNTSHQTTPYFNISGALGQEYDKRHWAELVIPISYNRVSEYKGKYKVVPTVLIPGKGESIIADPAYEFDYGDCYLETSADSILVDCDGSHDTFTVTGNFDKLMYDGEYALGEAPNGFVEVTGDKGYMQLKLKKDKAIRNISPINERHTSITFYGLRTNEYGEIFVSPSKSYRIKVAPNTCEDPVNVKFSLAAIANSSLSKMKWTIFRTDRGWHCKGSFDENPSFNLREVCNAEFDVQAEPYPVCTIYDNNGDVYEDNYIDYSDYARFTINNGTVTYKMINEENNETIQSVSDTFTCIPANGSGYFDNDQPTIKVQEQGEAPVGSFYTENGNLISLSVVFKSNEEWSNSE